MTKPASLIVVAACGALFGFGLTVSAMIRPEVVLGFLRFHDLGLLLVLGGAAGVALVIYQLAPRVLARPVLEASFQTRPSTMDARTLGGAALFGVGWGLCGVCPGPAIAALGAGDWRIGIALAGIIAGAYLHGRFFAA